jgi:hypothetical protein
LPSALMARIGTQDSKTRGLQVRLNEHSPPFSQQVV